MIFIEYVTQNSRHSKTPLEVLNKTSGQNIKEGKAGLAAAV